MDDWSVWIDNARIRTGSIQSYLDAPQKRPRFYDDADPFRAHPCGESILLWVLHCALQK
jgi:hypothetical protein